MAAAPLATNEGAVVGSVDDLLPEPFELLQSSDATAELEAAFLYDYDLESNLWERTESTVEVALNHFAVGAMRCCFRLTIKGEGSHEDHHVAKKYYGLAATKERPIDYFVDVAMLCEAAHLAEQFNQQSPPKEVHYFRGFVLECRERNAFYACEPMLSRRRKFERHNNNDGWCDDRATPQAFSHFTYEATKRQRLLVDIQGTGDEYTDPQFHSIDGEGYGKGNLGKDGIDKFFKTHICNKICESLNLPKRGNFSAQPPRRQTPVPALLADAAAKAQFPQKRRSTPGGL